MAEPTLESMKGMEDHVPGERDSRDALTRELEWDQLQEVRSGQVRRGGAGTFPPEAASARDPGPPAETAVADDLQEQTPPG